MSWRKVSTHIVAGDGVCAAHSGDTATGFAEMVEEGIREAAVMAEVPCEVVRPLRLGVEVAA